MKRIDFIRLAGLGGAAFSFNFPTYGTEPTTNKLPIPKGQLSDLKNEAYWAKVAEAFDQQHPFRQLENGYFSPMPLYTNKAYTQYAADINRRTSWFMRKEQQEALEEARKMLADFLHTDTEQVAITRNTTESMNTVIQGFPWQQGDEVIIGNQDYGSMVAAFKQVEKRYGVIIRVAEVPLHPESDEEVVQAYLKHLNERTRMLHLTHLINLSGQIIPVAPIARIAREKGVLVAVDSAHAIAQIQFNINDLEADFVGASLHKWLSAPLGLGLLWARRSAISKIWPLMADDSYAEDDIRKFEHLGTRPVQAHMSIAQAIAFHRQIGSELKEKRLRMLKEEWHENLRQLPGIIDFTPAGKRSCAIACVGVRGMTPSVLSEKLYQDYNIFTVAIDHPIIKGVRITPHLFTSLEDVRSLRQALEEIAS